MRETFAIMAALVELREALLIAFSYDIIDYEEFLIVFKLILECFPPTDAFLTSIVSYYRITYCTAF